MKSADGDSRYFDTQDSDPGSAAPLVKQQEEIKQQQQQLEGQLGRLAAQLQKANHQISQEKAGKRKIFHSLVKLANELKKARQSPDAQRWYEGGIWRNQVKVLPGVGNPGARGGGSEAVSLSDLFLDLVIVTAFTRVGEAISNSREISTESVLYFAVFWTIWSKEASYSSRFDTQDLSAKLETLLTCFAVLFGSLSASAPMESDGATRIMMVAAFCAILHCLLHLRIAVVFAPDRSLIAFNSGYNKGPDARRPTLGLSRANETRQHVQSYALINVIMTFLEAAVWIVGIVAVPTEAPYRWVIFLVGIILALRVPRAFLANDFHAACSKRGVLFILLLGFLLQSIVVVASEFFQYDTPTWEQYGFLGASCLILFCIKLLYVEDSHDTTPAKDHALLVNRWAAFLFNMGQFALLFSTTVMGSGLNLVTHQYLAATAALPGPSKRLVVGGFSAVALSNFFIKSMHVKRVPSENSRHRTMFIAAYLTEMLVTLAVVAVTAAWTQGVGGYLEQQVMEVGGTELLFALAGLALFLVFISWLDQGVELSLYDSAADSLEFRVQPFGLWSFCLQQEVTDETMLETLVGEDASLSRRLSAVSPLLGSSSAAFLKQELKETEGYGSVAQGMGDSAV